MKSKYPIDTETDGQYIDPPVDEVDAAQAVPRAAEAQTAPHADDVTSTFRAAVMYALSLLFLCLTALVLPHGGIFDYSSELALRNTWVKWALILGWLTIGAEAVYGFRSAPDAFKPALTRLIMVCLIPPLRMTISPAVPNRYLWLPRQGWLHTGKEQLENMEWRTAMPMLLVTLLILPVIGAEMFFHDQVVQSPLLMLTLHLLTSMIWFAFAYEFILLVSVSDRKVDFCKAHWVNIVIILLPLVAFLRTLQCFRFLRIAKASQLMRAYRLRGLLTRAMRLAMVFNLIERLMQRNPHKYRLHLEEAIRAKEEELEALKAKLHHVQATLIEDDTIATYKQG